MNGRYNGALVKGGTYLYILLLVYVLLWIQLKTMNRYES